MQVAKEKKGGPYTKDQQEVRRTEVYRLHFEYGYSAVKIAELMKINRNTINSDINFLYSRIAENIQAANVEALVLKQLERFELQRARLVEELEKEHNLHEKLVIERLIFDVDNRITQLITRISNSTLQFLKPPENQMTEQVVKDMTRKLVFTFSELRFDGSASKDEIRFEIINIKKCTTDEAEEILDKMVDFGLELCLSNDMTVEVRFSLIRFALLRGYVSINEIAKIHEKMEQRDKEIHKHKKIEKELEAKFVKKYGMEPSKWTDEIYDEYDREFEELVKNN